MFATIIGPYPQIEGDPHERLVATVSDQLDAGLGMLSDGWVHDVVTAGTTRVVAAWQAADDVGRHLAAVAEIETPQVKACLLGPWSSGNGDPTRVRAAARTLGTVIGPLFDAGAPIVQLTEPRVGDIDAADEATIDLLEEVLSSLATVAPGHVSLALAGGGPTAVPPERLFAAPFASFLFDLIRSPDDWRLCARVPADAGLIVGVSDARTPDPDTEAVSVWGARYAASLRGRGPGRVGLCTSAGLESLSRSAARAKLASLAEAARKAELPREALADVVDPRMVDARSAALGRYEPPPLDAAGSPADLSKLVAALRVRPEAQDTDDRVGIESLRHGP